MKTIGTLIMAFFLSCNLVVAQDTLYIYKAGTVLYKQVVTNIDSVTFKPITGDTVIRSPVQQQILAIVKSLGLASVSSSTKLNANSIIRKGDVVEFSYYDDEAGCNYDFKLNEDTSDKNNMVFEGTSTDTGSGKVVNIRRTVSQINNGISVKEERILNGQYAVLDTKQYFANSDRTVDEYFCNSDGTNTKTFVWRPNGPTSLAKKAVATGTEAAVNNISIILK